MAPAASRARLLDLVGSFAGRRIVVVGDYVLDRFVFGHPKRVSREAPVLVLRFWKEEELPGGAGNTTANIRSLGGVPLPVGVLGRDGAGEALRRIFAERGISTEGLLEAPGYPTPTKTRILGGGPHAIQQQIVRYDREGRLPEDGALWSTLARLLSEQARGVAGAVLSDYGYGAVSPAAVAPLKAALSPGAPVLVDSRHDLLSYSGVDAITPNEEELEECAGFPIGDSEEALARAARGVADRIGCRAVLVTRGSRGMALFDGAAAPRWIPVHGTDQVADVTRAGDTVLATFSLALASGASPAEAALLANFAGGVVVMKTGTAVVTPEELKDAIAADRTILDRKTEDGRRKTVDE
ncbi:MAG: bifunctional heptose 7-phosphate kinase/heptose 1-phosphate adenyltransferase [Thermoanaerobaculia bacterium]